MKTALSAAAALLALASALPAQLPPDRTYQLYVGDFLNDRVVSYDQAGNVRSTFSAPGLDGPRGVLVANSGRIYVASEHADRVFVFDARERFLFSFTDAALDGPTGMALGPSGELFVSSFHNNRICVFDLAGAFRRIVTVPGFSSPNCVAFDSAGFLYATNAFTGLVVKFDPSETFVGAFTAPAPFALQSPMSIAIRGQAPELLFVSGGLSDNICVFTTGGTFLAQLVHPDLPQPQGLAFDERGHLFATSFSLDTLVEFDDGLNWVRTITAGGLDTPRSLAFARRPLLQRLRDDFQPR